MSVSDDLERVRLLYWRNFHALGEKDYLVLSITNDFEPNGKASETWEDIYTLGFKHIPPYYKTTTGWKLASGYIGMMFRGSTLEITVSRALDFFEWLTKQ